MAVKGQFFFLAFNSSTMKRLSSLGYPCGVSLNFDKPHMKGADASHMGSRLIGSVMHPTRRILRCHQILDFRLKIQVLLLGSAPDQLGTGDCRVDFDSEDCVGYAEDIAEIMSESDMIGLGRGGRRRGRHVRCCCPSYWWCYHCRIFGVWSSAPPRATLDLCVIWRSFHQHQRRLRR